MPAQSGDPISSALQVSLVKESTKKPIDISALLVYSAKQVLLTDIQYEEYQYDSTSVLSSLKTKYRVISEKDSSDVNSVNQVVNRVSTKTNGLNRTDTDKVDKSDHRTESKFSAVKLPAPEKVLCPPESIVLGWKDHSPVGSGFVNLGNSCYINSTLQALFHISGFVNWLLMEDSHSCNSKTLGGSSTDCLICAVSQTLKCSQESSGRAIKPFQIFNKLKAICKHLNPGLQEDAHEFLRHLVDSLDRTYLLAYKGMRLDHLSKETTPLSHIFGGYLRNEVTCQSCNHISTTFQYFQDLPLDIRLATHIDGALDSFFSKEAVSEQEGYICENCKKKVAFTKKFWIEKAPRVLCIQLKRFGGLSGKNNKSVGIISKLNMNKFRSEACTSFFSTYHLAAIVNHLGSSTYCGHYTALAMAADSKIYLFDDQRVERLNDLSQFSSHAYILLYEQKPSKNFNSLPNGLKHNTPVTKINNVVKPILASSSNESATEKVMVGVEAKNFVGPNMKPEAGVKKVDLTPGQPSSSGNNERSFKEVVYAKNPVTVTSPAKMADTWTLQERELSKPTSSGSNFSKGADVRSHQESSFGSSSRINVPTKRTDEVAVSNKSTVTFNGNGHTSKSLVPYNESSCSSSECPSPEWNCGNGESQAKKSEGNTTKNMSSPNLVNGSMPRPTISSPRASNFGNNQDGGNVQSNWSLWEVSQNSGQSRSWPGTSKGWKVQSVQLEKKDFKSQMMSMNHRGYGKNVPSWSGESSEMDKEVNRENITNKRLNQSLDDQFEYSNKKVKKFHNGDSSYGGRNRFDDAQKRLKWTLKQGNGNSPYQNNFFRGGQRPENKFHHRPRSWHHI